VVVVKRASPVQADRDHLICTIPKVPIGDSPELGGRLDTRQSKSSVADQSVTISTLVPWFESCPLTSTPLSTRQQSPWSSANADVASLGK